MGIGSIIAAAIGAIGALLTSLKGSGVNLGSIGDVAARDISEIQGGEADYLNGQAVIVGDVSYNGKPGVVAVFEVGGPAYQAIFGSNS